MPVRFCVSVEHFGTKGSVKKTLQTGHLPSDRHLLETLTNELAIYVDEYICSKEFSLDRGMTIRMEVQG